MFRPAFSKILKTSTLTAAMAMLASLLASSPLYAVPSMARQTGMPCASCHTVYPELTPFGRQFKLRGFSMSGPEREKSLLTILPVSALLQSSLTSTANTNTPGAKSSDFPHNDDLILQAAGVYYGGKIIGNSGALVQFSYDGIESRWLMEMFDARYADSFTLADKEWVYGLTLSNTPTLTDIYNSTPQWAFPNTESAAVQSAAPLLDLQLASQVGGLGGYVMWDNLAYAEVDFYKSGRLGFARALTAGAKIENVVDDYAPYWRVALQREWASQSLSVGTYGMVADLFPEGQVSGPSNRFRDIAFDAQYQHYLGEDHIFTAQANYIHEQQDWTASFAEDEASNRHDTLKTLKLTARYYFQRTYGLGVQYFWTRGTRDELLYNTGAPVFGSIAGSPNTDGWLAELNYLPVPYLKLALRYTGYTQFNGGSNNYDGFGRNAGDNNSLFVLAWLLF